jgi:hypothetical protein
MCKARDTIGRTLAFSHMAETNGQNGHGKSRLDRIEEMMERQLIANEAEHDFFRAEGKRLLTAQILMNGAMQKMVETVQIVIDGMASLESKIQETTGKLNALIDTFEGIIRDGIIRDGIFRKDTDGLKT